MVLLYYSLTASYNCFNLLLFICNTILNCYRALKRKKKNTLKSKLCALKNIHTAAQTAYTLDYTCVHNSPVSAQQISSG